MDEVTVAKKERERLHEDIERIRMTLMSEEEDSEESEDEREKLLDQSDARFGPTTSQSQGKYIPLFLHFRIANLNNCDKSALSYILFKFWPQSLSCQTIFWKLFNLLVVLMYDYGNAHLNVDDGQLFPQFLFLGPI